MNGTVNKPTEIVESATLGFFDRAEIISRETMEDERYTVANQEADTWLDRLLTSLTDEQKEWFSNYEEAAAETESVMAEHAYRQGMADGVAMMADWKRERRAR